MTVLTGKPGFASPAAVQFTGKGRRAGVEIFATLALAASLLVAATAVSIGVARAQAIHSVVVRL